MHTKTHESIARKIDRAIADIAHTPSDGTDLFDAEADELEVMRAAWVEKLVELRPPLCAADFANAALGALYDAAIKHPRAPFRELVAACHEKHRAAATLLDRALFETRAAVTSGPARRIRERSLVRRAGREDDPVRALELVDAALDLRRSVVEP
jgi:hypothetical protein